MILPYTIRQEEIGGGGLVVWEDDPRKSHVFLLERVKEPDDKLCR